MEKGIRIIPSLGDGIQHISKPVAPTTFDIAYPVATIWIYQISALIGKAYIHCGAGVWVQIGGSGGGGEWGPAVSVTISGGVIAVAAGQWYKVDTQASAASDNLDTISGLVEGEEVMLSAANGSRTVVLKNGTGNLSIRIDTPLNDVVDRVILMHDGTNLVEASSRP